jgi:hypothetical protein
MVSIDVGDVDVADSLPDSGSYDLPANAFPTPGTHALRASRSRLVGLNSPESTSVVTVLRDTSVSVE